MSYNECESCLLGKITKSPFIRHNERATKLLDIIHNDVCRPLTMQVRNKYSYLVTFTNDLSKYCYVYPIKHKSECFENFKQLKSEVEK